MDIWVYSKTSDKKLAAVQCKAWNTWKVGVKPVRELYGVMAGEKVQHGMFVTTGVFSSEARAFVGGKDVKLIDGADFLGKIQGLPEEAQDRLLREATKGDFTTPSCPKCGQKLVRRDSTAGEFWGCRSYPKCRGKISGSRSSAPVN